ncbi:MAG: glycoside hydrolase family 5 protein [Wujia sp.]
MRRISKKITAVAMSAMMLMSMTACGKSDNKDDKATGTDATSTSDSSSTGSESDNGSEGTIDEGMTAAEFTRLMGNGINLGNTMEATGRSKDNPAPSVQACETAWGQPVTTQEMISGMKAAGFDTLRIPTGWANMMDYTNGDYTIDTAYLDRIEEITNYALSENMYVIINDHWDNQWWGMFGDADETVREDAWEMYEAIWTQVGERFKDYDEHVIFESANEELGSRLNDDWHLGSTQTGVLNESECYETVNAINQKFVDIIRAQGGNNAQRFLLIAGYDTNIASTCDSRFVMPTDTINNRLLVSVHYYDPSDYCIFEGRSTWGSKEDYQYAYDTLQQLTKFVDAGYGVVIGEYGALPSWENGNAKVKENTALYNTNILNLCDLFGLVPVLWDTNALYNKNFCEIIDSDLRAEYASRNVEAQANLSDDEIKAQAQAAYDEACENAVEAYELDEQQAMAWIMFTSGDWGVQYIVGDKYDPTGVNESIIATDVEITGEGTYTVGLDFSGMNGGYVSGTAFSALGIANGEDLFPGYIIDIKEIKINGETYNQIANEYTTSDDTHCTRVNLYNSWVPAGSEPEDARTIDGSRDGISAMIIDGANLGNVKTIEITFDYVAP